MKPIKKIEPIENDIPNIEAAMTWWGSEKRNVKLNVSQIVSEYIKFVRGIVKLPGRNEPCYCMSGRKFKKCCQQ